MTLEEGQKETAVLRICENYFGNFPGELSEEALSKAIKDFYSKFDSQLEDLNLEATENNCLYASGYLTAWVMDHEPKGIECLEKFISIEQKQVNFFV